MAAGPVRPRIEPAGVRGRDLAQHQHGPSVRPQPQGPAAGLTPPLRWSISGLLALKRDDLDLEVGYAGTSAEAHKGRRDARVKLRSAAIVHMKRVRTLDTAALPWN